MGNKRSKSTGFAFKQFYVKHEVNAMKVCTEACMLGAWVDVGNAERILDIGTGTGIVSLFLVQRSSAQVTGLEIDAEFASEAAFNFSKSPWAQRLFIHQEAIETYQSTEGFDHIISNPPFFIDQLASTDPLKNQAKHSSTLDHEHFFENIKRNSKPYGKVTLLLPPSSLEFYKQKAELLGFHVERSVEIKNFESGPIFRHIITWRLGQIKESNTESLVIFDASGQYTPTFRTLLKDFYLHF